MVQLVNRVNSWYCLVMKRVLVLVAFLCLVHSAVWAEQIKKVDIFVTSWCPYCRKLEGFLKQSGIDYTRHDVEKDRGSAQEFESFGGEGVPVTRVGETIVRGYAPQEILAALKS